ncbi:HEPN domain-containing protein [Paenibacillus xylanexedens]|uniref:HEPN domain-containing protein n=1 Tax=Paenibacillus xylanexedens TaxID=528191 RepID=UPI003D033BFC
MPSKSFEKFTKTINRCEILVDTYIDLKAISDQDEISNPTKDIVRAAVVLSVAALDAYVTDVFAEKLVPYLKRYTPDDSLIKILSDAGLNTKEALTLLKMDRPYRRIRTLIEIYYSKYTTQKFEVIDKLFLQYRLKNITENAARKSGKVLIKKSVEALIQRRHDIAHDGDYNSHGRIKDISEVVILRRINDLNILVTMMDELICNKIP